MRNSFETQPALFVSSTKLYHPSLDGLDDTEVRPLEWDWLLVFDLVAGPHRSVADIAKERNIDPEETMIGLALEHNLKLFFMQPIANENQDEALEMMKYPRSVVTFSDAGAHVTQIMDDSWQPHIVSHWVREKQAFTLEEAARLTTYYTATHLVIP